MTSQHTGLNMARGSDEQEQAQKKVTDLDAVKDNTGAAVEAFAERWAPMPRFAVGVEVMDARQLRDAMGLRASIDWGDPWPEAEKKLLEMGFRWHWLGANRVMFLQERDEFIQSGGDTGWQDAVEWNEED